MAAKKKTTKKGKAKDRPLPKRINQLGKYTLSRLQGEEFEQVEDDIRDLREAQARKTLSRSRLSPDDRERIVVETTLQPIGLGMIHDYCVTQTGFRRLLLLSLRIKHPEATEKTLDELEFQAGGVVRLVMWILGVDGLPQSPVDGPPGGSGSPPREGGRSS